MPQLDSRRLGYKTSGTKPYGSDVKIKNLKNRVKELSARVLKLEQEAEAARDMESGNIIVLRNIGKDQAKEEILGAFETGEPLDHADLAESLQMEISLVFEACNELIDEGLVVFYDDNRD